MESKNYTARGRFPFIFAAAADDLSTFPRDRVVAALDVTAVYQSNGDAHARTQTRTEQLRAGVNENVQEPRRYICLTNWDRTAKLRRNHYGEKELKVFFTTFSPRTLVVRVTKSKLTLAKSLSAVRVCCCWFFFFVFPAFAGRVFPFHHQIKADENYITNEEKKE